MLNKAIRIVASGFENVMDKGGQPYFLHCYRVAQPFIGVDDELAQAALLHDVVEDGIMTLSELVAEGFSPRVVHVVCVLTHMKNESYDSYIKRVAVNDDARKIKLADLKDNSDITRLKGLNKKDFDRIEKYHRAYEYLKY